MFTEVQVHQSPEVTIELLFDAHGLIHQLMFLEVQCASASVLQIAVIRFP